MGIHEDEEEDEEAIWDKRAIWDLTRPEPTRIHNQCEESAFGALIKAIRKKNATRRRHT